LHEEECKAMPDPAIIDLGQLHFPSAETILARHGGLAASIFRFPSGVKALRLRNGAGEIVLLPYHGQQIWDAEFLGRRLTMHSMFDTPVDTSDYLANYGAFLLHCGALAMGNPGPQDTHPLHGELPNAKYQQAELIIGEDGQGPFMGLTGTYHHKMAFTANYLAMPVIKLHAGSTQIHMELAVHNLFHRPMDLMYLAHINFRPADGGVLLDTVPDGADHIRVRTKLPEFFTPTASHVEMIAELKTDPARHRNIVAGRPIDPELVMGLDYSTGPDGLAHSLQVHPDGTSDVVTHRPAELPRAVRWMTRTQDQDAMGLVLPATAEADGKTAEKAKGNVRTLAFDEVWRCNLSFGALDKARTEAMRGKIAAIRKT
jgi:Domain of unknown function (DUF4432)